MKILGIFVDTCTLFERQPEMDELMAGKNAAPSLSLFVLTLLETRGKGLPATFVDALGRAGFITASTHSSVRRTGRMPAVAVQISPAR